MEKLRMNGKQSTVGLTIRRLKNEYLLKNHSNEKLKENNTYTNCGKILCKILVRKSKENSKGK